MACERDAAGAPIAPCFKCERRNAECHSHCVDYAEFKDAVDEMRKEERSYKMALDYARHAKPARKEKKR